LNVPTHFDAFAELQDASIFMDVAPLMEIAWTGIANVTANLARQLRHRCPHNSYFFFQDKIIDPGALLTAIDHAPGDYLGTILANGYADLGHVNDYIGRRPWSIGLFPNVKTAHRLFDFELVVLHDLSAMLMPELHEAWAAQLHTKAMLDDIRSSDLVCCVSEATRQDAITYLGAPPGDAFVSHLGVHRPPRSGPVPAQRQDFAIVLGTVEPRKNLRLVADYLLSRPDLGQRLAMVFVGRRGWGPGFDQIFGELLHEPSWRDRIIFTDYIDEAAKWALLESARFAIYPSLFEGFGLPVAECMAAGCPVIVSRTSSLVEFDLPSDMTFDPMSLTDFARAFRAIEGRSPTEIRQLSKQLADQSRHYTWEECFNRILRAIVERRARTSRRTDKPAANLALSHATWA
jgi:glycosyltransferase involved in cell wall biosynthesis